MNAPSNAACAASISSANAACSADSIAAANQACCAANSAETNTELHYLETLRAQFPTTTSAGIEIANLKSASALPKETEFFVSDIHGEFAAFSHILRNASGNIRRLIDGVFADELTPEEKRTLASLIYYPEARCQIDAAQAVEAYTGITGFKDATGSENPVGAPSSNDPAEATGPEKPAGALNSSIPAEATDPKQLAALQAFYQETISRLASLARPLALRHSQERVVALLPDRWVPIVTSLIDRAPNFDRTYLDQLTFALVNTNTAATLVAQLAKLIQHLSVDHLHMVGDVFDRGPYPDLIMEELMRFPSIDIQWGNHDMVWMGAALGQWGCIAHVVRNCARYGNLSILEDSYGINMRPLATFAQTVYADDPCIGYALKGDPGLSEAEHELNVKIQKAMAILQFKVEAKHIADNPSFNLESRNLLHTIDIDAKTIELDGTVYDITDPVFPTVDWSDPYNLTPEETEVMEALEAAFVGCDKLQRHVDFLLEVGSLYTIYNGNLLFHACVPLNPDGSLKEVDISGKTYKGRALFDACDKWVRRAFNSQDPEERRMGKDLIWYMWLGEGSPLFAKSKMATFEIYLIADKAARKEVKNPFYSLFDRAEVFDAIFKDFGLDPKTAHIISGHVPVKVKDGEDPVKCGGKVLTIDGGFSSAYQKTTGIAGFTLIYSSDGYFLDSHKPLPSTQAAIEDKLDIESDRRVVELAESPVLVANTDLGVWMQQQVNDLVMVYKLNESIN